MEKELGVYISASIEMDPECELLGQLLAETPKSIQWVIKRTPTAHEEANPDLELLRNSHFYLLLLGMDITAPIGVELRAALESGATVLAYRDPGRLLSPAGSAFVRNTRFTWHPYRTPQDFVQKFERTLITLLLDGTPGYGLELRDIEELAQRLKTLDQGREQSEDERQGAGRGGVILAAP